jgi:hypothetical protein
LVDAQAGDRRDQPRFWRLDLDGVLFVPAQPFICDARSFTSSTSDFSKELSSTIFCSASIAGNTAGALLTSFKRHSTATVSNVAVVAFITSGDE